jgi:hypothetical protein
MNSPSMAPRSYAYSGGERVPYFSPQRSEVENAMGAITSDPREVPTTGVLYGVCPSWWRWRRFLRTINDIAGALLPLADVALSFKRGYEGFPLPGRGAQDARMAGDALIFKVYEQMMKRNEQEAIQARQDREAANQKDLERQIILEGVRSNKIPFEDALKALKTGQYEFGAPAPTEPLPSQAPATPAR